MDDIVLDSGNSNNIEGMPDKIGEGVDSVLDMRNNAVFNKKAVSVGDKNFLNKKLDAFNGINISQSSIVKSIPGSQQNKEAFGMKI